jgi:hypothetical protein
VLGKDTGRSAANDKEQGRSTSPDGVEEVIPVDVTGITSDRGSLLIRHQWAILDAHFYGPPNNVGLGGAKMPASWSSMITSSADP